jgi:hypothetical protein
VIAEHEINTVFDERAIAQLLAVLKSSPDAKLFTETDRQRFPDSIRTAVRCYLAESARTDWPAITKHIGKLYRVLEKVEGGRAEAGELAKQVEATNAATREWLQRCVLQRCVGLTFPLAAEIKNKETRRASMRRLRRMLCDGCDWVEGRNRPGGRRSRSRQPRLRVPQKSRPNGRPTIAGGRGRPLKTAVRSGDGTEIDDASVCSIVI